MKSFIYNPKRFLLLKICLIFTIIKLLIFSGPLKGDLHLIKILSRLLSDDIRCNQNEPRWEKRKKISNGRSLQIDLNNLECKWTPGAPLGLNYTGFGLLLAAYPGSGVRLGWQHIEGLTGILSGDDFMCAEDELNRTGLIKTHYPHYEGIWSWKNSMDQVVLFVRNPRTALPSYLRILSELEFAQDCETAYGLRQALFKEEKEEKVLELWIKWRDYKFKDELELWAFHIDYWMEDGKRFWMDWDYERNGQRPFSFLKEEERFQDVQCANYKIDCKPQAIVAYELLSSDIYGPDEAKKIANVLVGKPGISIVDDEARECIWHATTNAEKARNENDRNGIEATEFPFTFSQLLEMKATIEIMITKYSSSSWIDVTNAGYLVVYFKMYIFQLNQEIAEMELDMPPTPFPNSQYQADLKIWYDSTGRGDRYGKVYAQKMHGFWMANKHLYDD